MNKFLFIMMVVITQFAHASQTSSHKQPTSSAVERLMAIENNQAHSKKVLVGLSNLNADSGKIISGEPIYYDGVPLLGATDDQTRKELRWQALEELLAKHKK